MEYLTSVPMYGWRNGTVEQWDNYKNNLNCKDWCEISENLSVHEKVDILLRNIENAVMASFENLKDKKVKKK